MAQLRVDYELLVVFSTREGDDVAETLKTSFRTRIADNAEITEEEDWGKRRLAYEIDYQTEAYYYLVRFNSKPDFPAELEHRFGITDGVLRYLIINDTEYKLKREKAKAKSKKAAAEAKIAAEKAEAEKAAAEAKLEAEKVEAEKAAAEAAKLEAEKVETKATTEVEKVVSEVIADAEITAEANE